MQKGLVLTWLKSLSTVCWTHFGDCLIYNFQMPKMFVGHTLDIMPKMFVGHTLDFVCFITFKSVNYANLGHALNWYV